METEAETEGAAVCSPQRLEEAGSSLPQSSPPLCPACPAQPCPQVVSPQNRLVPLEPQIATFFWNKDIWISQDETDLGVACVAPSVERSTQAMISGS